MSTEYRDESDAQLAGSDHGPVGGADITATRVGGRPLPTSCPGGGARPFVTGAVGAGSAAVGAGRLGSGGISGPVRK